MVWAQQDSRNIMDELVNVGGIVLKKIGCHTEPHEVNGKGKTRTTLWKQGQDGQRRYKGILYHYTGGVSTIGAMRWANHPGWGNEGSSWHVTIADRMTDNVVGEEWAKIDDELRRLFPVPTIIMADFRWGTWHGNWTNNMTLGVENRNGGYWGYNKAKGGLHGLGKKGKQVGTRMWEEYTKEQMVSNVNLGRLANGLVEGTMDPDWILSHQCIYAKKQDTGPLFPIHSVRNAIFAGGDLTAQTWLKAHPMAPDTNEDDDAHWEDKDELRLELDKDFVRWVTPSAETRDQEMDGGWIAEQMTRLGFNMQYEIPEAKSMRKQVRWFQRSTGAYRKKHPEWVLTPDGIYGPKTEEALVRRMSQMGFV